MAKSPEEQAVVELPQIEKPQVSETKTKKSEDEILFPDVEVDGFTIKPWTLGKLRKINPHLEQVVNTLAEKNIQLSLTTIDQHLMDIYFAAVPQIIAILALSLDKTENDLEDIPIPQAIKLLYFVYKQNEESIKNVSSLLQMSTPR